MRCIHIDPKDNIGVVVQDVPAGTPLSCDGIDFTTVDAIPRYNKVALEAIPNGGEVRRYGLLIGLATADIKIGQYVHTHNLRSAWLPTYDREHGAPQGDSHV